MTWPLVKYVTAKVLELEGTRLFTGVLKYVKEECEAG
jgi:hypothetical protein